MTALPDYRRDQSHGLSEAWTGLLGAAIASGRPHRVANAVRELAHAPRLDDVEALALGVCDTIASHGYVTRDSGTIARVTSARSVIAAALGELRDTIEHAPPDEAQLQETVDGYVRLVALYDPLLAERLDAVGAFAGRIARAMSLGRATVVECGLAGRLHDIGLIALARRDRNHLEHHAVIGESFVRALPALANLAPIVRSHHEHVDGTGYPDRLHAEEIPLAARIVGVAATFIELVSESPHREALPPHDACIELLHSAGTQHDASVVAATLRLVQYRQRSTRTA
jgi:HD-GYP domain-containing protein (c-di-GMP phosphodiesterase class II)